MPRPRSVRISVEGVLERYCTQGDHWLPATVEVFGRNKLRCDGLNPHCKQCTHVRGKAYRKAHPEHLKRAAESNKRRNQLESVRQERVRQVQERRKIKKSLPFSFTAEDSLRMKEYWNWKCAVCESNPGDQNPLCEDHWISIRDKDCPGTVSTNMLPLCRRCNSSKGNRRPDLWLFEKYGYAIGQAKLNQIAAYFRTLIAIPSETAF
jgi:hypothetical protein